MYNSQPVFPTVVPNLNTSVSHGITYEQLATLLCLQAMLSNPHYAPFSMYDIVQKAKEATSALCASL